MRKIIYTLADGSLWVVNPVVNTYPVPEAITEEAAEQRAWSKLPTNSINPQFVDASAIPADQTFRNAWKANGAAIEHDMPKARELHKETLRELRADKFEPLEEAQRTAIVAGDTAEAQRLEVELQKLRDVTADPAIDAATTPEQLKAVIPDVLREVRQ